MTIYGYTGTRADGVPVTMTGSPPSDTTDVTTYPDAASFAPVIAAAMAYKAAPTTPYVPTIVSRRQFFQQLAIESVITQAEAIAAMGGQTPPEFNALIAALPSAQQFGATMEIAGATEFNIADPITVALGTAKGWSKDQINALWTAAAAL